MQIQKISNQNFGVTILSDKIQRTLLKERIDIENFWGYYSPQYDYLYQLQQQIDDLHSNGVLDLREGEKDFSLLLLRQNDFNPIIKKYKNVKLSSKLIADFLKNIKNNAKIR